MSETVYSWFVTTWQGGHVEGQYNIILPRRIYVKIEFSTQRREMLLFLITNMVQTRKTLHVYPLFGGFLPLAQHGHDVKLFAVTFSRGFRKKREEFKSKKIHLHFTQIEWVIIIALKEPDMYLRPYGYMYIELMERRWRPDWSRGGGRGAGMVEQGLLPR